MATVYGRFHYVLDVIAGVLLAAAIFATYRWVRRKHPTAPEGDTS